ncbi:MAG: sensor domain-containing diguanylate cyclase [Candidatus Velthaea sp.]
MKHPAEPENEAERLSALRLLNVLDTPAEERFDRITRLALRLLGSPIAMVNLIDRDRQWVKSAQGTSMTESSRAASFCGHAILGEDTFVVEDATLDQRFFDNPYVSGEAGVRFYAGHPVRATDGSAVGTLCLLGNEPRTMDEADRSALRDLAMLVEIELQRSEAVDTQADLLQERDELRRRARIDSLTRVWNRSAILELLDGHFNKAQRGGRLAVAMLDADCFKEINDTHGHQAGDHVLAEISTRMRAALRLFDAVGRYGGEEFCLIIADCDGKIAEAVIERIRTSIASKPVETPVGPVAVTVSIGLAFYDPGMTSGADLIAAADRALYRAKAEGRDRVVNA